MTLDDMKETLGKSKTSMSTAIRTLLDYNLVERVWVKGVRKDLYQAEKDLYHKFMKTYVNRWLNAIERQKENLSSIKNELEKESTPHHFTENRIKEAIHFHESLETAFLSIQRKSK
ncbi:hypothetical protein CEY16_00500 [Halalkalibacillus sediminis]|uniref:Transcriptional regulator n=2 Tax=Halalkalibacillus sediminis TaxID=2018042 RepID=A0A2I0QYF9_9BACI|nr:hypothetical protein CEY16_00500 [Halalkalibacillus sediminis]